MDSLSLFKEQVTEEIELRINNPLSFNTTLKLVALLAIAEAEPHNTVKT